MADYLDHLCEFLCEADFDALPDTVHQRAALVTADTIAAIVAASDEPEMRALTGSMLNTSTGNASVLGTGLRAGADVAGFLNGSAGTFLELDEGNRFQPRTPRRSCVTRIAWRRGNGQDDRQGVLARSHSRLRSQRPHWHWCEAACIDASSRHLGNCRRRGGRGPTCTGKPGSDAGSHQRRRFARTREQCAVDVRRRFGAKHIRRISARAGLTAWQLVLAGFNGEKRLSVIHLGRSFVRRLAKRRTHRQSGDDVGNHAKLF